MTCCYGNIGPWRESLLSWKSKLAFCFNGSVRRKISVRVSVRLTFGSLYVRGGAERVRVPPRRGALQVVSRQAEPMRGQVKAWEAEVPDLGQGEASIQGRLGDGQRGLGFGRFAVTVQQVFDEERRVFGRGARLWGCLGHRCGCARSSEDHQNTSESRNEHKVDSHTHDVLAIKSLLSLFFFPPGDSIYLTPPTCPFRLEKHQSKRLVEVKHVDYRRGEVSSRNACSLGLLMLG